MLTTDPDTLVAAAIGGLMDGAIYGLVALGLSLVYAVLRVVNFAHFAFLLAAIAIGAFTGATLGLGAYATIGPLALLFFGLGYLLHRLVVTPAAGGHEGRIVLVTAGIGLALEGLVRLLLGDVSPVIAAEARTAVSVGVATVPLIKITGAATAIVVACMLLALLRFTLLGTVMRAVGRGGHGPLLAGIDVDHVRALTFGMAAASVAVAGSLLVPTLVAGTQSGQGLMLAVFAAAVLGGLGSASGAILAGLAVGVVLSLGRVWLEDGLAHAALALVVLAVLTVRPRALADARG